jgi:hypothetical protein
MLGLVLGFLTGMGPVISGIVTSVANTKAALAAAETDQERNKLRAEVDELNARRAVLIAEAGSRFATIMNVTIRSLLALGPVVLLLKVFVWDKSMGPFVGCVGDTTGVERCLKFTTDGLDTNLWAVVIAVIGFYFLYDMTARWRK